MKSQISTPAAAGIVAVIVVIIAAIAYFTMSGRPSADASTGTGGAATGAIGPIANYSHGGMKPPPGVQLPPQAQQYVGKH